MKIAFIGIGNVGFALANQLQQKGHQIIIAHNDNQSESLRSAIARNPAFGSAPVQVAINQADLVFLATPFQAYKEILAGLDFGGKTLVDCTNPVGAGISHGLQSQISGSQTIQDFCPTARLVKCFTIYGFENFANSTFPAYDVRPAMLFCGNDAAAKQPVPRLCEELGFEPVDTGGLDQALHLEHFTLLWVKMARRDGHQPNFTWAYLQR